MKWSWFLVPVLAMGPFEKNQPLIDEGQAAYARHDYEGALKSFDAADKELPNSAEVQFNRGTALHKLGRNEDARQAFLKAAELNQGKQPLESQIHYNLGNSWAATQNKKEAIAEYRKALRKGPGDENARHNMEVMLKDLPPPESSGADGGTPDGGKGDAGRPDAGQDGGQNQDGGKPQDGGSGDAGSGDAGSNGDAGTDGGNDGGQPGDGGQGDGGQGDGGSGKSEKKGDAGTQGNERGDAGTDGGSDGKDAGQAGEGEEGESRDGGSSMSKKDAERMLDSVKNSERNLQMWRFHPEDRERVRKSKTNEKDW